MRSTAVYKRKGKIIVYPCSKTVTGQWVDDYAQGIHVVDVGDFAAINEAMQDSLSKYREGLPHPDWSVPISEQIRPLLDAAEVTTNLEFMRGAKYIDVVLREGKIRFAPTRTDVPGQGFTGIKGASAEFPFDPNMDFASILAEMFERCE